MYTLVPIGRYMRATVVDIGMTEGCETLSWPGLVVCDSRHRLCWVGMHEMVQCDTCSEVRNTLSAECPA